jgi:hypothetical protein
MKPASSRMTRFFVPLFCMICLVWLVPEARGQDEVTIALNQARENGVSEEMLNRVLVLGYKHTLKSQQLVELIQLTEEAKEKDFPVEPVVSKMEEGLAKRVHVQAIQQAAREEISRYIMVRTLVQQTLTRRGIPAREIPQVELARVANILAMGISVKEMKEFFEEAPLAPMNALVEALDFMAALRQSGLSRETTRQIVFAGMQKGFFSKSVWALASTIQAAKFKHLPEDMVKTEAIAVVQGEKSLTQAQQALGLQSRDLGRGPQVTSPAAPGPGQGRSGAQGRGRGPGADGAGLGSGAGMGMGGAGGGGFGGGGAGGGDGGGGHGGR